MLQVLIGGALIGLASVLLMATNGRIAGISSIVHRAVFLRGEESWTIWFVLGLMLGPAGLLLSGWLTPPSIEIDWGSIVVGGVLVLRLHAFLALILAALAVGLLTPSTAVEHGVAWARRKEAPSRP